VAYAQRVTYPDRYHARSLRTGRYLGRPAIMTR
jgi:hypothetical protein